MNRVLLEHIVRHIFSNFVITSSSFVDVSKSKSLMSTDFLLSEKLSFEVDNNKIIKNDVWGCQIAIDQQIMIILLGDCSHEKNINEYCLITQIKNGPAYGLYFIDQIGDESMLACTLDGKEWMECQTFLQATFLAGIEQIRDIGSSWNKCVSYKDQFNLLLSCIKFHDTIYEEKYEG